MHGFVDTGCLRAEALGYVYEADLRRLNQAAQADSVSHASADAQTMAL